MCCKIYGSNAGGLRLKASTTPGSWGRVFAKRRGALADNRLPGGMACVPNKGAATHWWSNANSACMASAGGAGGHRAVGYCRTAVAEWRD